MLAGNLSGGEQQMLTLAPLLVRPPSVLIADEPTLGLAPLIVAEVLDVIVDLRDEGVAVLLVQENARALLDIADEVAFVRLGRIVWTGLPTELTEAHLAEAYLGSADSIVHQSVDGDRPGTDRPQEELAHGTP